MTWETLVYFVGLALVIALEHWIFGRRWRRFELARRTMGIATVLGLAWPLVQVGVLDFCTWFLLVCGFGVAGAVTAGLYTWEWSHERQNRAMALRGEINGYTEVEQR